jgi:osmotically-inducible protein OsmY
MLFERINIMRNLKKLALISATGLLMAATAFTGCQTRQSGDRTAGRALDDRMISKNVEKKLEKEPVYKFSDVDVKTFAGVVQLSGFVSSEEQKSRAGELARSVEGVERVVNNITLIPGTSPGLTPTGRANDLNQPIQSDPNR